VPKLDDLSYERLFQIARSRIPAFTADWTDFNDHDPGITMLQTFAWLTDTLNYYIDATGEAHRLKYLRLLGLAPARAAAQSLVALAGSEKQIAIAKGAKLAAGETIFETAASYTGAANRMTALFQETNGSFLDLTPFAGVDGEFATLFTYDKTKQPALYIGFDKELGGDVRFYADIPLHPERNPFADDFTLSQLRWEYFDGKGWREAQALEDSTCGFLRSGFVTLSTESKTKLLKQHPLLPTAQYLRATLVKNEYDVLPLLGRLYPNCVNAIQTDTHAQALEVLFDGEAELAIDYHVRENDVLCVAVEDGAGYSLWYQHVFDEDSLCEVVAGEKPWQRIVRFDRERFGAFPEAGQKILITITDVGAFETLQLGVTTGFARDQMELDIPHLYELRLALVEEKDGRLYVQPWDESDDIAHAAPDERAFQVDRATGIITFGDGIHGVQPPAGRLVIAVTAKTSLLDGGNVRENRIDRLLDPAYEGITVTNPEDATGGKRPKTSLELERDIEEKIYKTSRAVTAEDYEQIVGDTPGLMIDSVNVISSAEYARFYGGERRPNTVLIAVKPASGHDPRPVLGETYRRRIRENLEQYRLLTTDVRVLPAKYVGIEANGRIVLTENTPALRSRVEEQLAALVSPQGSDPFGASIIYGRLFSRLEMLEGVAKVSDLSLTCYGEGAHKNEQGDIVVYPDATAYLGKINIEFA
jgi:hypothetical protein